MPGRIQLDGRDQGQIPTAQSDGDLPVNAVRGVPVDVSAGAHGVSLRRLPFPYRALLAVCSDLDGTPDRDIYWETMRFLNTTQTTLMGRGVGLEVGNSIYFDMPHGQFSYWNTDDAGRAMVRALIQTGHIDCLHSFGDLAITRAHAERALNELVRYQCKLEVWVDHAVAPSNFGADIMRGLGDVPGSPVYHADLTCGFGIQYVWRGRVTSMIGQDVEPTFGGIHHPRHPMASARTLAKEFSKRVLARLGNVKYAMHGPNEVIRETRLRGGQRVYEFIRCNPHWGGVNRGETPEGLADVLVEPILAHLIKRGGMCLLYTHLGKIQTRHEPFGPSARRALRLLADFQREGKVLVTTTRRLLGYCRVVREVAISVSGDPSSLCIDLTVRAKQAERPLQDADLAGLTIYVPNPSATRVVLNGHQITPFRRNGPDETGRRSISLPWERLEFPNLNLGRLRR